MLCRIWDGTAPVLQGRRSCSLGLEFLSSFAVITCSAPFRNVGTYRQTGMQTDTSARGGGGYMGPSGEKYVLVLTMSYLHPFVAAVTVVLVAFFHLADGARLGCDRR